MYSPHPVPRRPDHLIGPDRSRFVPVPGLLGDPDGGTLPGGKAGYHGGAILLEFDDFDVPGKVILYHQQRSSIARRLRRVVRVRLCSGGGPCGTGTHEKDRRSCDENLMKRAHRTPGAGRRDPWRVFRRINGTPVRSNDHDSATFGGSARSGED